MSNQPIPQGFSSSPLEVTVYTKRDCHLCDDLLLELTAMQSSLDFTIVKRDIEQDAEEYQRYRYLIPVVRLATNEEFHPPHDRSIIERAIRAAIVAEVNE